MTLGAIVIPLAALALCAAGFGLAWSLVRRAESQADEDAAPLGAADQTQVEQDQPAEAAATAQQRPGGAVRIVGQLMALAGFALGMAGIVVVLWRAFALHPIWLVVSLLAIGGATVVLVWRIYRHGTVPPPSP